MSDQSGCKRLFNNYVTLCIPQQSSILHISFNNHHEILILDQLQRFYLYRETTRFDRLPFTNFVVIYKLNESALFHYKLHFK